MAQPQPGILDDLPSSARYLTFNLRPQADPRLALEALRPHPADGGLVVGLGPSIVHALGAEVGGLRPHPTLEGPGFDVPSTPAALWCWLRGHDRGDLVHATRDPAAAGIGELDGMLEMGASPRAAIYLTKAAKAHAFLQGRGYVTPEDIKQVAIDVLQHRIIVTYEAEAEEISAAEIVRQILDQVEVP